MTPTNNTHSALHKALKHSVKKDAPKLSSNFTYLTMLKVAKLNEEMARKRERRSLIWTIAIVLFMIISGGTVIGVCFGEEIVKSFSNVGSSIGESFSKDTWTITPFMIIFSLSITILLVADHVLRRIYMKRHPDK